MGSVTARLVMGATTVVVVAWFAGLMLGLALGARL